LAALVVVERAEGRVDAGVIASKPVLTILATGLFAGIAGLTSLVVGLIFSVGPEPWFCFGCRSGSGVAMTFIGDVVGRWSEQETPTSSAFGFRHSLNLFDWSTHTAAT
jgi:hypothetical protein